MQDAVAVKVRQCHRLIIILSAVAKLSAHASEEEELLGVSQNHLCYEQKIGLHDALTLNDPKVILVEIGEMLESTDMNNMLLWSESSTPPSNSLNFFMLAP